MKGLRPGTFRSAPAGMASLVPLTGVLLRASRDTVAAAESPPRKLPAYAATAPTAPPMSQRRPGLAAPAAVAEGAAARLRNQRPATVPRIVGSTSAGPAPG